MAAGLLSTGLCGIIIMTLIGLGLSSATAEPDVTPPPYQLNRADEDYSYLRDPTRRTDFWDFLKYIPLNAPGSWYLSLGGEARERFEYFKNPNWGAGPPGPGYLLQRYFLNSDLHMSEHVRLFAQIQSSLENFRVGGVQDPSYGQDLRRDNWNLTLSHNLILSSGIFNSLHFQVGSRKKDPRDWVRQWRRYPTDPGILQAQRVHRYRI